MGKKRGNDEEDIVGVEVCIWVEVETIIILDIPMAEEEEEDMMLDIIMVCIRIVLHTFVNRRKLLSGEKKKNININLQKKKKQKKRELYLHKNNHKQTNLGEAFYL